MNYTEEQLMEAYQKLPGDIQQAIADAETEKKITAIGERHNLHIDQIGELSDETGLVMLGLNHPNKFITNLINRLGLAPHEAETIAQEVNTEVLAAIRDTIRNLANQSGSESITRDQVLSEIENPPPAKAVETKPTEIFEQKVSQIFNLPSEKGDATPQKPWEKDPYLEKP